MIVLEQINTLLCSSDPVARCNANNYLMQWQQTAEAWNDSHMILNGNFPLEAKFIAAQTMRTKIMFDFYQLPSDSLSKLCETLLSYLCHLQLPRNISSVLELAVCDLAVQSADIWNCPSDSFIASYHSGRLSLDTLLYLLETLPEEALDNRIIVTQSVRENIDNNLVKEYEKVVSFLLGLRNSGRCNVEQTSRTLRCWYSWRRFDQSSYNSQAFCVFLGDCLAIISHSNSRSLEVKDEVYESAIDCVIDVLKEITYVSSDTLHADEKDLYNDYHGGERDKMVYSEKKVQDLQSIFRSCFNMCTSKEFLQSLSLAFFDNNISLYFCLSKLYVNLMDLFPFYLPGDDSGLFKLIDVVAHFVELPYCLVFSNIGLMDVSKRINCFAAGYDRLDCRNSIINLLSSPNCSETLQNDMGTVDEELCGCAYMAIYSISDILSRQRSRAADELVRSMCTSLIHITILVSTLPVTVSDRTALSGDNNDTLDVYEKYVENVHEMLSPIAKVLGSNIVFEVVRNHALKQPEFPQNIHVLESGFKTMGASIYLLDLKQPSSSMLDTVAQIINTVQLVLLSNDRMNEQPQNIVTLKLWISALRFLNDIRRFLLVDHSEALVKQCYHILCSLLKSIFTFEHPNSSYTHIIKRELVLTLSNVSYYTRLGRLKCWEILLSYLMQSIDAITNFSRSNCEGDAELSLLIIEGTATAISTLAEGVIVGVVEQVVNRWIQSLEVGVTNRTISRVSLKQLIDRICFLIRNIRKKNILSELVCGKIVPLLLRLLKLFYNDLDLVETMCRCLKHSARSVEIAFVKSVPFVTYAISEVAQEKITCTYLYVVEWLHAILPLDHKNEPEYNEAAKSVKNLYILLTKLTLAALGGQDSARRLEDPQEIVEDFFCLQTRFIKCTSLLLEDVQLLKQIVALSTMCFGISEPHCLFGFWIALLASSKNNQQCHQVCIEYMPNTICSIFEIMSNGCQNSVEHRIEDFVDSMVNHLGKPEATKWLQVGCKRLPKSIVPNEKQEQLLVDAIIKDVAQKRHITLYQVHRLCCQVAMRNRNQLNN